MKFSHWPQVSIRFSIALMGVVLLAVAGCSSGSGPAGDASEPAHTQKFAGMLKQGKSPREIRQVLDRQAKGLPEPAEPNQAAATTIKKQH